MGGDGEVGGGVDKCSFLSFSACVVEKHAVACTPVIMFSLQRNTETHVGLSVHFGDAQ